jgi:hypothetical protein
VISLRVRQLVRCVSVFAAVLAVGLTFTAHANAKGDPSLVPISWAFDVRNGTSSNVAVAVPWSFDYSRWHLSNGQPLLRFFPHISLLGSGDAKTASLTRCPHFAMGYGLGLVDVLAVGVGLKVNEPFAHAYVMVGVSLTDLLKFVL